MKIIRTPPIMPPAAQEAGESTEVLLIPQITLRWSEWVLWPAIKASTVPESSGVYEVRDPYTEERLQIGQSQNLRRRIVGQLIRGVRHSTGKKILEAEDISQLRVRWATTDRPAAAEEELFKQYCARYIRPPRHAG